jgi:hypothetical protein
MINGPENDEEKNYTFAARFLQNPPFYYTRINKIVRKKYWSK